MKRSKSYLGFGLAALFALVAVAFFLADQIQTTSAAGGGPEMRLTANGCAADCTFATSEKFTLAVEIVAAPPEGYVGAQSFIVYGSDLTYDIDLLPQSDEVVWPDCEGLTAVRAQTIGPEVVNHGCLTGLLPPQPVSTYVGNLVEISLTCSTADSVTEVELLPTGDPVALTSGAAFGTPDLVPAKVSNLSITCGAGAPVDTPTPPAATDTPGPTATTGPTNTPGPTATTGPTNTPAPATDTPVPPTATPIPDSVCGDVDRDGSVTTLDALWVLWVDAGLVTHLKPIKDNNQDSIPDPIGDLNGDGLTDSRDATVILQVEAGLYTCV